MSAPQMPDLVTLSCLDDPVRRRLYGFVSRQAEPVGRDEAASGAGIGRALAAYHLDKLVEAGLLAATFERLGGRTGPGAGRPAKLYSRSAREFAVSVPPREYELAARLLVQAVDADSSGRGREALHAAAYRLGTEIGSQQASRPSPDPEGENDASAPKLRALDAALTAYGYEPEHGADDITRLRNCPFHQLAQLHRDTICGMNLALIDGVTTGLRAGPLRPVLDPQPGYCCVTIGTARP